MISERDFPDRFCSLSNVFSLLEDNEKAVIRVFVFFINNTYKLRKVKPSLPLFL